jgi:hypothetical protein
MYHPSRAGNPNKIAADFSDYFGKSFLADYTVELISSSNGAPSRRSDAITAGSCQAFQDNFPLQQRATIPAHAIVLCRASKLLRDCIEIDAEGDSIEEG